MHIDIAADVLRRRRLFVATPMYGGQASGHYVMAMCELSRWCAENDVALQTCFLMNDALITRARARMVDEFLRSDSTHLMFIDDDIGFDPGDVISLLALAGEDSAYDVIAAAYPKKDIAWQQVLAHARARPDASPEVLQETGLTFAFNPLDGGERHEVPADRPLEVREAGTGFMMIRRDTFALFDRHYPEYRLRPGPGGNGTAAAAQPMMLYFECGFDPDTGCYLSEDYAFCQRIRKAGGRIWLCPWMRLSHVGAHVHSGSLAEAEGWSHGSPHS
ncbi:glycosyltransferase family 2 protein [Luteimonas salinilitoris]|uniref:Glycosyltransferase family 2 protein n=1 Tax=Luteimonas salinilitoris TaxID=3237697 RepID=A0ABV4HRV3_9GAMM